VSWWAEWRINPRGGEGKDERARRKRWRRGWEGGRVGGGGDGSVATYSTHRGRWQQDVCEVSLLLLDGGKREESPMSHTPLHRATVLPLNTTPRGALRPPSSPSATKNKLARSTVRTSGCPRARARARALASVLPSLSRYPSLFLALSLSLSFSFFF